MFRYRRNSKGMFDNLDDPGGFPIREQDIQILRDNNIPFEIVDDVVDNFDEEYAELLIDELVKSGKSHLSNVDNEIARMAEVRKEIRGIKRLENELTAGEQQLARVMKNKQLFRDAGVPESMIDTEIGAKKATFKKGVKGLPFGKPLDKLYSGKGEPVPVPLIFEKDGKTRRVFTRYEENPVTGVLEVVPFMDGNQAMYMDEGMYPVERRRMAGGRMQNVPLLPGGHNLASELVMEKALKLMDEGAVSLNNQVRGKEHRSDFKRRDSRGKQRQTEGMIRISDGFGTNTVAIPSHTKLIPDYQDSRSVTDDVKRKVKAEMDRSNSSIIDATEKLVELGKLGPNDPTRYGKLLRADKSRVAPDERYDELIISGYPMDVQADPAFRSQALVEAPATLHLAKNLDAVRKTAARVKDKSKLVTGVDNTGVGADRTPRSKMQVVLPIEDRLFTDMAVQYPHTMQLLKDFSQYLG